VNHCALGYASSPNKTGRSRNSWVGHMHDVQEMGGLGGLVGWPMNGIVDQDDRFSTSLVAVAGKR
jgi:hypothetical protein